MDPVHLRSLFLSYRSSRPEVLCEKDVHFAKFIGKNPCWNLFFNEVAGFNELVVYIERHSQNLDEHLSGSFLAVNYFRKKLHLRCSTGF